MLSSRQLLLVIAGNGMLRIAAGASSLLVGVYLAELADRGHPLGAGLVGTLAAISFGVELAGAVPIGLLSDAVPARTLMTSGAVLAAFAVWIFGLTEDVGVFVVSRALEGLAAAAGVPPLLAFVTDETATDSGLRAKAMSYFELSLLAGLALGAVVGSQLWTRLHAGAFTMLAFLYGAAAILLFVATRRKAAHRRTAVWKGFIHALTTPQLRRLAPIWLCMNIIVGLWLGPTFYFLLMTRSADSQLLSGLFANDPAGLGWLLFAYSVVFAAGVLMWSRVLPRTALRRALSVSLAAMVAVSLGLLLLNHMAGQSIAMRWIVTGVIAVLIMVESGFSPAALSLLAGAVGSGVGRGSAMGIYSFLLGLGALAGSVLAGAVGRWWAIDGLIYVTLALAAVSLGLLSRLAAEPQASKVRA